VGDGSGSLEAEHTGSDPAYGEGNPVEIIPGVGTIVRPASRIILCNASGGAAIDQECKNHYRDQNKERFKKFERHDYSLLSKITMLFHLLVFGF
jgi:hypothetical protein